MSIGNRESGENLGVDFHVSVVSWVLLSLPCQRCGWITRRQESNRTAWHCDCYETRVPSLPPTSSENSQAHRLPSLLRQLELVLLHPRNTDIDLVERAPVPRTLRVQLRILRRLARCRDPQVFARECAACHVSCWQYNFAHRFALRADAQHLSVAVHSLPDIAFDINGESVGFGASVKLPENAWVGYSTGGGVKVVGVDGGLCGVYEVEGCIRERPADTVRNDEFGPVRCTDEVRVEA